MAQFLSVTVEGDRQLRRKLARAAIKVSDLAAVWQRIGAKVRGDAQGLAPVLTGRLRNSIRAGRGKSKATVRAGKPSMEPYVPIQHYGGYHNIEAKPFMTTALHRNKRYAQQQVEREVMNLLDRL
jgi:phage gpG-like protein